ncbi:MAG: hypothetical protein ACYTE3_19435 [Planctomycetota bacterium]|jgi:hypothetical protein
MGILSRFTDPPKPASPGYRYKTLVVMLCLLAFMTIIHLTRTSTPTDRSGDYAGIVLILAFLFYFVAHEFAWRTPVNVILRVLACIFAVFAISYTFYTTTPSHPSDPYSGVVLILAFLFFFLAGRFARSKRVSVILQVLAWLCIVFVFVYILYL